MLSPLDCLPAKAGGAVNGGAVCAVHLAVDWLGWLCYSFLYDLCLVDYLWLIALNAFIEERNSEKHGNKNIYQNDKCQYYGNYFPDTA